MKLKQAFDRLKFTISNQNKPNANDIEAFNKLAEFFKLKQKETIVEHQLFAKLYAFVLCEFTNHYTELDRANKEINKILSEPLDLRIEYLIIKAKEMELRNYFKRKRILDSFLKNKTVSELEEIHQRYLNTLPDLDPIEFAKCGNNWNKESIIYNLETNINLSIQNFKNNV
jgi:hypothetical protein